MKKGFSFVWLLFTVALAIAGCAAFFSIYGLANIYSATFISVIIMGSVLEVGKLVAVSALYRYWEKLNYLLRTYLFAAILILMVITSAGIYGYLSNGYQQDSVGLKDVGLKIELLQVEKEELDKREADIDTDIGRISSNYITKRMELIDKYAPEKEILTERRRELRAEIFKLSSKQLEVEAHTGPIIYIAKALGKTVDDAILWMTLLIIIVFDPLAVVLTLVGNIAIGRVKDEEEDDPDEDPEPPQPTRKLAEPTPVEDVVTKAEVDSGNEVFECTFPSDEDRKGKGSHVTELPTEERKFTIPGDELPPDYIEQRMAEIQEAVKEDKVVELYNLEPEVEEVEEVVPTAVVPKLSVPNAKFEILDEPTPKIETEDQLDVVADEHTHTHPVDIVSQEEQDKIKHTINRYRS